LARIFISYKRNASDDEGLVAMLSERFGGEHTIFVDKHIPPGADWAKHITEKLSESDYVFVLISESSVTSEMVRGEIETVRRLFDGTRPRLVPIRVRFTGDYPYPMNAYLDPYQWVGWDGPGDTARVLDALAATLAGRDLSGTPAQAKPATSAPVVEAGRVVRAVEKKAIRLLEAPDAVTVNVTGPRYIGKTQLVHSAGRAARRAGKAVALVDFKLFDGATLRDRFYRAFCEVIAAKLSLDLPIPTDWDRFPVLTSCTKFMERVLLAADKPVVLVLDALERLISEGVGADFFGMLRSWHDSRDDGPFEKLSMVLVATFNLTHFTKGADFSPFNVGQKVRLADFTLEETKELARHLNLQPGAAVIAQRLLDGHPWLTQLTFRAVLDERIVVTDQTTAADLITSEDSPFTDHLRLCLFSFDDIDAAITQDFGRALAGTRCSENSFAILEGAGFLKGSALKPRSRCELYREYLTPHFPAQ